MVSTISYSQVFWEVDGNPIVVPPGNQLGSINNAPIRFTTHDVDRMFIQDDGNTTINGTSVNTSGYIGINTNEPRSYLHINGPNNTVYSGNGYREWMQTGVFNLENSDHLFVGLMPLDSNRSDAVFSWGDDGIDYARFIFTGNSSPVGCTTCTATNPANPVGREIVRYAPNGYVGIGPYFETNGIQSNLHVYMESSTPVWFQLSNESGTGGAATDGLRMGVNGTGTGYIYNQENDPLIFSTNASTTTQLARERMRLTHIGATGVPATAATNLTRTAISLNPVLPLTAPRTILHIGSSLSGDPLSTDGVRDWMNVGLLATDSSDNVYLGLKKEATSDRMDAVIAWGDNQTDLNNNGPDNLRFIFAATENLFIPSSPTSKSPDGQEVARFTPIGQLGIGNFASTTGFASTANPIGPGTAGYIDATLDVNGDARVRLVTQVDSLYQVLVRDPNDSGRVHWRDAGTLGFGGECGTAEAIAATLTESRELPLGDFNLLFSGQDTTDGRVGIGLTGLIACMPEAKLHVSQELGMNETAVFGINTAPIIHDTLSDFPSGVGVRGFSITGDASTCEAVSIGGLFFSASSSVNMGVCGISQGDNSFICNTKNYGGFFVADNGEITNNIGVYAEAVVNPSPTAGSGNWAAYINGDGLITATAWTPSDAQLKENVQPLENVTSQLLQLHPVTYTFNHNVSPNLQLAHGQQFGVLAQELQGVFPNLVRKSEVPRRFTENGLEPQQGLSEISVVNYDGLIPVLLAAFQEQNQRIDQLQAQLNECCNRPKSMETGEENNGASQIGAVIQTRLENVDEPSLGQNIPNPFEGATSIPLYLPQNAAKAEIMFYGNDGKVLQILPVNDRGNVFVQVDASTLAAGVYSYTLFVDGKPVDTKRMVKR